MCAVAVLVLWAIPQVAAQAGLVDACAAGCPEDASNGVPCPPICLDCACSAPSAALPARVAQSPCAAVEPSLVRAMPLESARMPRVNTSPLFHPPKA